jgi:hypothetical protein
VTPTAEGSLQPRQGRVVLRLELEPGEPLTGSIAVDGQPEKRFCGWIELMAAVNAARAAGEGRSP